MKIWLEHESGPANTMELLWKSLSPYKRNSGLRSTKLTLVVLLLMAVACKKDCDVPNEICNEKIVQEACQAYFTRWFYNKNMNECVKISYSGCSEFGFATEQECDACKCR